MQESSGSSDEADGQAGHAFNPNAPHPYQLALGILCVQKVFANDECWGGGGGGGGGYHQ